MGSRNGIHIVRSAGWPAVISVAAIAAIAAWSPPSIAQQQQRQQESTPENKGGDFSVQPEYVTLGKTPLFLRRAESFTVRNHGKTAVRNLKVELTGANENVFSIDNKCGDSLAPGQQCEIRVGFEPTSDGEKSAEVRITAGDGAVRTRRVTGSGVAAKYTATPRSLTFGQVANGTTSKEQVVTITNTGDVNLPITATSLSGENEKQFAQSNDCPRELPIGKSCKSTVLFRPTWKGDHEATLTVWAKGGAPETKVRLTGTGTGADTAGVQRAGSRPSSAD
ncbi:MAG TPA: choice-of-anchor D domain-containing protein [Steroidobacteraceae bacterium]|nr:choice-of-anchor D domain-containing protein [Steroidobacteraceae bacterium]